MSGQASMRGGSLVDQAMRAVSAHIQANGLRVGDELPSEGYFAASLGVSRGVVREAVGALAALRLIEVANGRRPRVAAVDGAAIAASLDHAVATDQISVAEVWDVRRTIELRTAELAASSATPTEAARILELARAMAGEVDDLAAMTRSDVELHVTIARASHNALFVQIMSSFVPLMEVAVPAAWRTRSTAAQRREMAERHVALAEAIARGDVDAAALQMDLHFDASVGDTLRGLGELAPEGLSRREPAG